MTPDDSTLRNQKEFLLILFNQLFSRSQVRMPLMPSEIRDEVRAVLVDACRGKGENPTFLTAYQILARLPETTRDQLIQERQLGGKGAGVHYSAASVVADAAEQLQGIEIRYLDTLQLTIHVAGQAVEPGYEVCAIYRLS